MNRTKSKTALLILCASTMAATAGPKVLPVLNQPITDRQGLAGFPLTVDLNSAFGTEEIDDHVVRFTSQFLDGEGPVVLDMALFSNRTPITRTNFLQYVSDGDYVNSFIHRSVPGFVIQGGGFRINGSSIEAVPTDPPILNEFGVSNTLGTVSMARSNDPNSATSQWFVSLGANSDNLDYQNQGFTVFGRVTKDTFGNARIFGNPWLFPVFDYTALLGPTFDEFPLFNTHQIGSILIQELILFPSVALAPLPAGQAGESTTLTYAVISNSNPALATASIHPPATLNLTPQAGQAGVTTITVRATDSVGNTVDDTFVLTVNASDTYASWASRGFFPNNQSGINQNPDGDSLTNLQEYAFLGDPAVSNQSELPTLGETGVAPASQYLTLTFPVRKFTTGLSYVVEANNSLAGPWTSVWNSASGFEHAQVVATVKQADRTLVTIKDTAAIRDSQTRFLRTRVIQQ